MPQLRTRPERGSWTRSAAAAAFQPRRYYFMPLTVNAMHTSVTAIPKLIDKRQARRAPNTQPDNRPLLLSAVVIVLMARQIVRATSGRRRH